MPTPELLFRHAETLFHSGDEGAMGALENAREALLTAGSSESAAEADALLAEAWWHRGERDRCFEHLARAEELVRDQASGRAKARVLSQIARYRAIAGESDAAIAAGLEALAISEQLGLDGLRAQALNNIGIGRMNAGDISGSISDIEQSIEIARAINSPDAARGYNNLAVMKWMAGDAVEALRLRREALRVAISLGNLKSVKFYRSSLVVHLYVDGQWDDALTLADDLIAEAELEPHAGESVARERRALIRHARGDDAGALDDIRRAVDLARLVRDPQTLLPALSGWLRLAVESERWDEVEFVAEELLRELTVASVPSVVLVLDALWVARSGHVPDSLAPALATSQSAPLWEDVKTAILDGALRAGRFHAQ